MKVNANQLKRGWRPEETSSWWINGILLLSLSSSSESPSGRRLDRIDWTGIESKRKNRKSNLPVSWPPSFSRRQGKATADTSLLSIPPTSEDNRLKGWMSWCLQWASGELLLVFMFFCGYGMGNFKFTLSFSIFSPCLTFPPVLQFLEGLLRLLYDYHGAPVLE